jgi:DEAD/DEAH box helicase domain-containing protein
MSQKEALDAILASSEFAPHIVINRLIQAAEGQYAPFPAGLQPQIASALRNKGINALYTHQAEVWEQARAGRNVIVVTPTASGKTLCYNLPVLQTLLEESEARALYLFPTKALSQDQQSELNETVGQNDTDGGLPIKVVTYDGDTPDSLRIAARDTGRIVISNPDMLHAGVLPNHPKWIKFFSRLRYIVIDEAHAYRGVLGSHVANVIRRLRRIAAFYGSAPRFILCSATIGNPRELGAALIGDDNLVLVDKNGAPRGEKRIILYNPPLIDRVQGIRKASMTEGRKWMAALLKGGIKTILFAHSRIKTEVAASYVNEDLANLYTDNNRIRVEPYRGGLLPNERREIERGLREGTIHGVVSTNALELGIDIGGLDASIVAGFPGSFNSFWQQSGRAGRRGGTSVSVFIASASPVDQFIMNDSEWFFGKSAEEARLDPDNPYILTDHVKCACFELPFTDEELIEGEKSARELQSQLASQAAQVKQTPLTPQPPFAYGENAKYVLEYLEEDGIVRHTGGKWHWSDRSFPAESISLRSATADNVVIIDRTAGRNAVIGEMDRPSAKEMLFKNAVYIHRGRQYLVEELDIPNRKALVREADVNYFTDGLVKTDIKVLSEDEHTTQMQSQTGAALEVVVGDVLVRTQVSKYKKIKFHSHENIGYGDIDLGEEEMQTRAVMFLFSEEGGAGKILSGMDEETAGAALSGVGSLVKQIAPVYLLCDPRDLGIAERVRDPHFSEPALYIYDKYPGGTGLAEALSGKTAAVFQAALRIVTDCPCGNGCPSCVGPYGGKKEAAALLKALVS